MSPNQPIMEGVFAINKPPAISSAQVIRDVQSHFTPSKLFAPWITREQEKKENESHNQKKKRRSWKQKQVMQLKMGHGGTLDPMATGVLILGIGSGTKSLGSFLECTKSYETVVLFGAATDSYDTEGKVVARKPYQHVTREKVEEILSKFRGSIMQRPPVFSALRVQGKRLYEYAREGKEVPVEIKERPVRVEELEVMGWYEGGTHGWEWPELEAEGLEKEVASKVMHLDYGEESVSEGKKRKREEEETVNGAVVETIDEPEAKKPKTDEEPVASGALPDNSETDLAPAQLTALGPATASPSPSPSDPAAQSSSTKPCPAPAVRLRMTSTSGFYVRSLAHDLGLALNSAGIMASLVRTRQGDFQLGTNVLWYDDLAKGEEVWGPKVKSMLEEWKMKQEGKRAEEVAERMEEEGVEAGMEGGVQDGAKGGKEKGQGKRGDRADTHLPKPAARAKVRRNTSSPDE